MCLLRELYGAGVEKLRIEHQTVVVSAIFTYSIIQATLGSDLEDMLSFAFLTLHRPLQRRKLKSTL